MYDGNGNITEIANSSGVVQNRYVYDDLGQLIREDNREMGRSYTYDYDDAGNRIQKKEFAFTLGALGSDIGVYQYSYASSGWRDRLTYDDGSYDSISYDAIGNPISIEDSDDPDICTSLRWKGRLLMSFSDSEGPSVSFTYNADGIRTSKTVGGVKHKYTLDGSRIVSEVWTKNNIEYFLYFIYDENGSPAGIEYRTSEYEDGEFDYYFFDKNIFGDVIGVYNESGKKICTYTYNAWGECTVSVASGLTGYDFIMAHEYNPFRYRGYYYDIETKYYYLQTRYYNPEWGRFLNADGYVNANGDILGYNMFAYCNNNPVNWTDPTGEGWFSDLIDTLKSMYEQMRNKDGSHSLYDNDRFEDVNPFHEQIAVVSVSEPSFDVGEGSFGLGSYGADLYTGGWEWEHVDLSLLDFGHAEVAAEYKDGSFKFGASACIWSPSVAFSFDQWEIQVGAEVGSVGASISGSSEGFSYNGGTLIGINLKIKRK